MGGIGLSSTDLNRTPHTHVRTQYKIQDTHIRNNTPANIYMHRDNNKTICSTQYAHNLHTTICSTYTSAQNKTQYSTQNTAQRTLAQPQHRTTHSTHCIHKYSFDFIVEDYISKNSIIQLYTNIIHCAHLIDEVSK